MFAIIYLLGTFIADLLKSRRRLEVENLFLRHQLNIILRRPPQRLRLQGSDRALMVWMTRSLAKPAGFGSSCAARHHPAVASGRVQDLLALEMPRSARKTQNRA
jgi:hypothetical protein